MKTGEWRAFVFAQATPTGRGDKWTGREIRRVVARSTAEAVRIFAAPAASRDLSRQATR